MKLNDFLARDGITKSEFAIRIGTTTATVSRISDGIVVPRRGLLEAIHRETGGEVTPNDLVDLYPAQKGTYDE